MGPQPDRESGAKKPEAPTGEQPQEQNSEQAPDVPTEQPAAPAANDTENKHQ